MLAVYGVGERLSVEGSLSGLWSDDARLDNESTTDAKAVRARFGPRLHVGKSLCRMHARDWGSAWQIYADPAGWDG